MKPKKILVWISLLVLVDQARSEKEILLKKPDTTNQWRWTTFKSKVGSGWIHPSQDKPYSVCDVNRSPENWMFTDFIKTKGANRVDIQLFYTMRHCPKVGPCWKRTFYLYVYHSDGVVRPDQNTAGLTELSTITPDPSEKGIHFNATVSVATQLGGIYFGFFDNGTCAVLSKVVVSYNYCATKEQGQLVTFPQTVSPYNDSQHAYVEGRCLDKHSVSTTKLIAVCTSGGQWNISDNADCLCKPGYGFTARESQCKACLSNYYKSSTENSACQLCPSNSSPFPNKTSCFCHDRFYRFPRDAIKPCTGLPSAVNKVTISDRNSTAIILQWVPHTDASILYTIGWSQCKKEGVCHDPYVDAKYDPSTVPIKGDSVTVGELEPSTFYKFKVYSVNELNNLEPDMTKWNYKSVTGRTTGTGAKPTGDPSSSSSGLHGTAKSLVYYGLPAVGAALIILAIVLICVCRRKRSKDGYVPPEEFQMNGRIRLPSRGQKLYIDPSTYENPEEALKTFDKELDSNMIKLEKVIGGGEFGDVHKGVLRRPAEEPIPVAVKTLKSGYNLKNRQEFLAEASIMGQFCYPNVIFLEGVVTKNPPLMIVIEFMANGSLERFLKGKDGQLTVQQLLGMARGVASGMRYLAEMNFVHRDLAARNVLVTETLVCKVADFGLSRELENSAYETQGGKVPVRWTAPEAIEYRKFSMASDAWSYGIVLWEIMSFGERPYWDWGNFQVMDRVRQGYRLPAPVKCPKVIHDIMLDCWNVNRTKRPKFQECVKRLDVLIRSPDKLNDNLPMTQRMSSIEYTESTTVQEWLENIKMEQYGNIFEESGYKRLGDVMSLDVADLQRLGIHLIGHKNKIRKSIKEVCKKISKESTLSV